MKIQSLLPLYRKQGGKVLPAYLEIDIPGGDVNFGVGEPQGKRGSIYLPVSPFVTREAIEEFLGDYEVQKLPETLQHELKGFLDGVPILTEEGEEVLKKILSKLEALEKVLVLEPNEEILSKVKEAGIEASFILIPLKEEEEDE